MKELAWCIIPETLNTDRIYYLYALAVHVERYMMVISGANGLQCYGYVATYIQYKLDIFSLGSSTIPHTSQFEQWISCVFLQKLWIALAYEHQH